MSYILSIDTATEVCSVAVHADAILVSYVEVNVPKSHSALLVIMIDQALSNAGLNINQISAIAISQGPGSYTGLRIGVSTAKGLCFALDTPLIAIDTLKAMAWEAAQYYHDSFLMPMLDARRMEVYAAIYDQHLNEVMSPAPIIIDGGFVQSYLPDNPIILLGDGSSKARGIVEGENIKYIHGIIPNAKNMGKLALEKFKSNLFEDMAYFEPFYLKEFYTVQKAVKL